MSNNITRGLQQYKQKVLNDVKRGVAETTALLHTESSSRAPVDRGYLKKSIDYKINDGGLSSVVSVGADYAIYVEYGTGLYSEGPGGSRAKKFLGTI
ncbi:HK97 gp10 family phage protein (plasmid) [Staphylococcus delphini]